MTIGTVVLLPKAQLPDDSAGGSATDPAAERREIAADLMAHGVNVYVVPDAPAADGLDLTEKDSYIDSREKVHFNRLSAAERKALIEKDPAYGRVICRCETVTEGEIFAAIHSPIPPVSVAGIKRRTGAGMGRCQGGFCGPRVVDLLARELGVSPLTILQDRDGSEILTAYTKGEVRA